MLSLPSTSPILGEGGGGAGCCVRGVEESEGAEGALVPGSCAGPPGRVWGCFVSYLPVSSYA